MTGADQLPADIGRWGDLEIDWPLGGGNRTRSWRGRLGRRRVAVRVSRRSPASLDWELTLLGQLAEDGFIVPQPIPTDDGAIRVGAVSVHQWIEGRPPARESDWLDVVAELRRLHRSRPDHPQRPDACSITELTSARRSIDADLDGTPAAVVERCRPHLDRYLESQRRLIHGDPGPGNIRITPEGRIGLLDWDESRVDVPDLDLANLGVTVLTGDRAAAATGAAHAWETLNGWLVEPEYAASRLAHIPDVAASPEPTPDSVAASPEPVPDHLPGNGLSDGVVALAPRTVAETEAQLAGEDDEIVRWLTGGVASRARTRHYLANCERTWALGGCRRSFGIRLLGPDPVLVGSVDINLADVDLALDEANLSYAVFAPWRGRGLAARAVALAVGYLTTVDGQPRPTLKIDPANERSVALAGRCGFEPARSIEWVQPPLTVFHRPAA